MAEPGWRRLQAGFATPSQEARSPSGPDEGPALSGWTTSDEGQRKCCLDNGTPKASGPMKKYGGCVKNRRSGAPGGARAGNTARGTSKRCQIVASAVPALRLPQGGMR